MNELAEQRAPGHMLALRDVVAVDDLDGSRRVIARAGFTYRADAAAVEADPDAFSPIYTYTLEVAMVERSEAGTVLQERAWTVEQALPAALVSTEALASAWHALLERDSRGTVGAVGCTELDNGSYRIDAELDLTPAAIFETELELAGGRIGTSRQKRYELLT